MSVLKLIPRMALASYYDFLYVTSISLFFLLCVMCARKNPRLQTVIECTYTILAVISLIVALANIRLVKVQLI